VQRYGSMAWGVVLAILALAEPAAAGWVIEQVMRGDVEPGHMHVMLQSNRMKTVLVGPDGRPMMAHILDLDAQTITQVDYARRSYAAATVQEYAQVMRDAMGAAGQAMQQMREALRDMPPEQRQMMEQMMRSQAGGAPQDCREPQVEIRKTGQQATIAGYRAVRHDVFADGRPSAELWVASALTAWRELDPQKLERFSMEMARAFPVCGAGPARAALLSRDDAWRLAAEGYPVRTVHRNGGTTTIEVVRAESRVLPAAEFQPPAGFARRSLSDLMGRQ